MAKPCMALQKEWAGGGSDCKAAGLTGRTSQCTLPQATEGDGGAADKQGGEALPYPNAYTGPHDCSSVATCLTSASPWGRRREVLVFQRDLRFLWLPKDTKFERHSLSQSSPEKRAVPGLYRAHCHDMKGLLTR